MKDLNLPEPIAGYFEADRRGADAVARCFTKDGVVRDEGHTYTGVAAIEKWKAGTSAQYSYIAEPFALEKKDGKHMVTSRVSGDFPGSPVNLQFVFTLERGKIATLEIAP
jgi:hypothetical protein